MDLKTVFSSSLYYHILLTTNFLLTNLLSQNLNLYSSLDIRHKITHPHKVRGTMSILHSPTVSWIQTTSEARNNKYLLNVNSTLQKNKFKSSSLCITWSDIGFDSPLQHQWPVTLYALKPDITLPPWKDIRHESLQEIHSYRTSSEITIFREAFQEFLPWMKHPIQTSHLILWIWTFVLFSTQYVAAQSVQWLGYTLKYLGFKTWQEQENYLFSKKFSPATATT